MLRIQNFGIETTNGKELLKDINFDLDQGVFLAVVGESGSGKSLTVLSIAQLLSHNLKTSGEILWEGKDIFQFSETEMTNFRKEQLAFIFQNPMHCLNPSMRCGKQLEEVLELKSFSKDQWENRLKKVLDQVELRETQRILQSYPHELSGGQKQRIMIAMALLSEAQLIIADEPTTALDVLVQDEILQLLKKIQEEIGVSILFITHDLNLAFQFADQILVMKDGRIVEQGTVEIIKNTPKELYTKALMLCRPQKIYQRPLPTVTQIMNDEKQTLSFKKKALNQEHILFSIKELCFGYEENKTILHHINLDVYEGESLGIVGASGSGKSTLGRCIMRLSEEYSGSIHWKNEKEIREIPISDYRKNIQMIFQDPYGSLDARAKVSKQLGELYQIYQPKLNKKERIIAISQLLVQVGLTPDFFDKRPREMSGGQRQRICIARALITGAKVLILDESLAALDVSIQATMMNLLNDLREKFGLTYLFISHDLQSVNYFCDRILVLNQGKIEELNSSEALIKNPQSVYTQKLISTAFIG
ncbi:MAG: ABC transporter ATP-binding protein [Flavobacteriales bacterium]|jgi:peptide/nickel transport system ATP-binding protein|nr:ABC transporter ATP-binding protein [Flavobacteriales bacterium]